MKEVIRDLVESDYCDEEEFYCGPLPDFMVHWEHAKGMAHKCGWEGDFFEKPRVFWLPDPDNGKFTYGFVIKQENNGTTFVISPVYLHNLRESLPDNYTRFQATSRSPMLGVPPELA